MAGKKYTPEQRINAFWNKVNKDGSIPVHMPHLGKCWEWTASLVQGYGSFGKGHAHRFSWELHNGAIPVGLWVLHKCDNRSCVNPDHLFLGTCQDNVDDLWAKDRGARGEKHYMTKLTENEVIEIRKRYAAGGVSYTDLCVEYHVSFSTIAFVIRRVSWKHIK